MSRRKPAGKAIRKGIRAATVTRVEPPRRGRRWKYLPAGACWCVAWRTEMMPASSFWYFRTKAEAIDAATSVCP